jgi:hypothetical protein
MRKLLLLSGAFGVGVVLFFSATSFVLADDQPCRDMCSGTLLPGGSIDYSLGYRFTVDATGTVNGLATNVNESGGYYDIKLWNDDTKNLLNAVSVTSITHLWVAATITPTTVYPGINYIVTTDNPAGTNYYYYASGALFPYTVGDVTAVDTVYFPGHGAISGEAYTDSLVYGLADINFTLGTSPTPTPCTTCWFPIAGGASGYIGGIVAYSHVADWSKLSNIVPYLVGIPSGALLVFLVIELLISGAKKVTRSKRY